MGKRKRTGRTGALAAVALLSAAYIGFTPIGSAAAAPKPGKYVVGQIADLTGGFTEADVPFNIGISADVKAINAAGGIHGHKIDLVTLDTAGSTSRAASDLSTLASDHALIATNMSDSTIFESLIPTATRDHIPLMGIQPGQTQVSAANGYGFEFGLSATRSVKVMLDSVAKTNKRAKVMAVVTNDPDGAALSRSITKQLKKLGIKYLGSVAPATSSDFGSAAARVVADGATVLLTELVGTTEVTFARDLSAAGFSKQNEIIGMAWSLTSTPFPWAHFATVEQYRETGKTKAAKAYERVMRASGVSPTKVMVVDGYAEMQIVANVLNRCGWPCSQSKFHSKLEHTNTNLGGLAFGRIVFTRANHFGPTAGALLEYNAKGYPVRYGPTAAHLTKS